MSIATYSDLQAAIADWLNRGDLTAQIPTFISLAEADFNRRLRTRQMLCRATTDLLEHFTPLPPDFLEGRNVQLDTQPLTPLEYVTLEVADDMRSTVHAHAGKPRFYTIIGATIEAIPIPDAPYQIELTYYGKIPALSSGSPTNWLLSAAPDLYLYASLTHAAPYLKDDERLPMWVEWSNKLIADLNAESDRAEHSGSSLKIRAPMW
jgi:hypothetical protein